VDADTVEVTLTDADAASAAASATAVANAINAHFVGLTTLADASAADGSVVLNGATGSNISFSSSESITTEVITEGASSGLVVVNAAAGAVLNPAHLEDATTVKLEGDASIDASDFAQLADVLDLNGNDLTVTNYVSGSLDSAIAKNGGKLFVQTATDATLIASDLLAADGINLSADVTADATEAVSIADRLTTAFDLAGNELTLTNYSDQDLANITVDNASFDRLSVVLQNSVSEADLSGNTITLDPSLLASASTVTFGTDQPAPDGERLTSVEVDMADLSTLASQSVVLDQNGRDVSITSYSSGDIDLFSGDSGDIEVLAVGASLDPSELVTATSVVVNGGLSTLHAVDTVDPATPNSASEAVMSLLAKTSTANGGVLEAALAPFTYISYQETADPLLVVDSSALSFGYTDLSLTLTQDAAILSEIVDIESATTLVVSGYVDRDLSHITRLSEGGALEVKLADNADDAVTLSGSFLETASKITTADGDQLTIAADAQLTNLSELALGVDSNLLVTGDSLSTLNAPQLTSITGTPTQTVDNVVVGVEKLIFKSDAPLDGSVRESINLKSVATLTDLDGFEINASDEADGATPVVAVRLSESLSSVGTEVHLDADNGQSDYVFMASQIFSNTTAEIDSGNYDNLGAKILGFDSRRDSIGLVDGATGEVLFERRQYGFPNTGVALDGYVYFDPNTIGDYSEVSFVRDQIGSQVSQIAAGETFGVVIFNDNLETGRYDAGLFQVAGSESEGIDPDQTQNNFRVLPIAEFIDVDAFNFTSALSNKFVIGKLSTDGQYDLS